MNNMLEALSSLGVSRRALSNNRTPRIESGIRVMFALMSLLFVGLLLTSIALAPA
ncbi:hypothetical protein GCM10007895_04350 [Paraferrimonas sedimenticola]|uniref:Uncharacterized protein n=1 Tax=Paraferrimonas sedimenticola TaxID=375674 RepID=A0AA37RUL1_9GAMM|nr:hypothetical protein GCM10007895_04350 [Paraferrimonas sedimenticola]